MKDQNPSEILKSVFSCRAWGEVLFKQQQHKIQMQAHIKNNHLLEDLEVLVALVALFFLDLP